MLQQLSGKMKNLVRRTKLLANATPEDPSSSQTSAAATTTPATSTSATTTQTTPVVQRPRGVSVQSVEKPAMPRKPSSSTLVVITDEKPAPLKGCLKKQGADMLKAWKTRYFTQSGSVLSYFYNENDPKALGTIDIAQITEVVEVNRTQFDLITQGRVYHLGTVPKSAGKT